MRVYSRVFQQLLQLDSKTCRARIKEYDGFVNAFVRTSEEPLNASPLAEGRKGIEGWTVGVKDNICTKDMGTSCSSGMLKDFEPGYDATVVRLLRAQGADIIGKTNCDEFGMGSMNIYSIHGPVINPYNTPASLSHPGPGTSPSRVAGGSSGGSAAAVAAGMCRVALGTDTGGSIRLPASYCGVVGLKPSYGLLSRWGVVSYADSLDCVGILGGDVESVKETFRVLNVYDPRDPTSASVEKRERARERTERRIKKIKSGGDLRGLRVGVPKEYFPRELSREVVDGVRKVLRGLKERGAEIKGVSLPNTEYALSAYYVLASAEASSNLARYDGVQYGLNVRASERMTASEMYALTRSSGFGSEAKRRILLGTYALSADKFDNYFLQAQRVRELVGKDFEEVFEEVDVLVHGSGVGIAPTTDSGYVQDVLTVPGSLGGLPGLSVPVDQIGVSIVGEWGSEELLFTVVMGSNSSIV